MKAPTIFLALALAALMVLAGPLPDEVADAGLQAETVQDAKAQAQQTADMARWARRVCASPAAMTVQVDGDQVACIDAQGQRVASITIAQGVE